MNIPSIAIKQAGRKEADQPTTVRRFDKLSASIFALLFSGIAAADGTPRGQFAVWAVGLRNGYVIMEHQAPAVQVTAEDVARGVLDVQGGTRIVVTTTAPSGVALDFRSRGNLFRTVQIDGIGSSSELGPAGGTIIESETAVGRRVVTVNYRFMLASNTAPGTYAWPLAIAVRTAVVADVSHVGRGRGTVTPAGINTERPAWKVLGAPRLKIQPSVDLEGSVPVGA